MSNKALIRLALPLAAVGLAAGCRVSGAPSATPSSASGTSAAPPAASSLERDYERVVTQALPSVVQITAGNALGSGVVFDPQGDIVTNAHVVGSSTTFQVTLSTGGKPLPARLVGAYPPDDLAVIHVEGGPSLRPAHFGDSGKLRVGQIVLAMGNPLGYSGSVTNGIVSGVGRTVTEPQGGGSPGATIANAIQTSAAINPGNSGGALVDLSGQVVGIPTLAAVDPQVGGTAPGIGFAIPSNTVTDIAGQIVKNGRVVSSHRAALGVRVLTVVNLAGRPAGVGVVDVTSGGPASAAGIQSGDVITAVNGTPTPTTAALQQVLAQLKPGDSVDVSLTRSDGTKTTVKVTLGQLPG